jgi:hypothetical protein
MGLEGLFEQGGLMKKLELKYYGEYRGRGRGGGGVAALGSTV